MLVLSTVAYAKAAVRAETLILSVTCLLVVWGIVRFGILPFWFWFGYLVFKFPSLCPTILVYIFSK